jgi:hypothetical protein
MHKKFYFCPGIFLLLASAMIFLISFSLESSIETKARSVVVDDLGNIYLLHETFIERRSTAGKESFRSSDFNYGSPRCLDITNPLKPFLHFPESGKIILFDNTLSQQGYWLWDAMNSEMIRTDHNFQKLFSSGNLSVLLHKELHPNQILERGDHVYLVDPVHGVIVFDIYGSYRTTLKIFPLFDLQSVNNQLIFMESAEIHVLSNDWISSELIEIPANNVNGLTYFNKKFYLLRNGFLEVWKE